MLHKIPSGGTASGTLLTPESVESFFRFRRDQLIKYYAQRQPDEYCSYTGVVEIVCRMFRCQGIETFEDELEKVLQDPHGDMFWMLPVTLIHYVGKRHLPKETLQRLRQQWKTYTPYRGDTENHWLMYYTAVYLMSQDYPGDAGSEWFNGRSSTENNDEAREYLEQWFSLVVERGLNEFDSPHYLPFYLAPLSMLYGFSRENKMIDNAKALLDLLVADFAADTLDGIYVGAHSRVYPKPLLERWKNGSTSFAWLLFGNTDFRPDNVNIVLERIGYRPHGAAAYLALSGYQPDAILHAIATDRSSEYVHLERKRTRTRIRRHLPRSRNVYKTAFVCKDFALGSIDGHVVQPVQQHSWELQWNPGSDEPGFNMLFCLHPYFSEDEMASFFPEEPELMADRVLEEKKPTYTSENKWTGGSPYQRIAQDRDALIVLFDLPENAVHPHIDAYFSRKLKSLIEDESGWIICHGGDTYIGYYPLAEYEWIDEPGGDKRLRSSARKNGAVVQAASASAYDSIDIFVEQLRLRMPQVELQNKPAVSYTTLRGSRFEFEYDSDPVVDERTIAYSDWPLYNGPFINSDASGKITLSGGGKSRVLQFDLPKERILLPNL